MRIVEEHTKEETAIIIKNLAKSGMKKLEISEKLEKTLIL